MCADLFHAGHINYLKQCKHYCSNVYLIVGLHSDETIASYKRQPICTMEERRVVLESCKYVDKVVLNAPFNVTKEYLIENNIDYVIHADGIDPKESQNMYGAAIELGLYREVPRTEGISTTELIVRIQQRKDPWGYIWHQKGLQEGDVAFLNGSWGDQDIDSTYISDKIKEICNLTAGDKILEVGCGAGWLGRHFDKKCYVGVDKSQSMIEKNKQLVGSPSVVSEANHLPFEDNAFEHVFIFSVVHYFQDIEYLESVLQECERVAKKHVFIGDLRQEGRQQVSGKDVIPHKFELKHLICPKSLFEAYGYTVDEPWFTGTYGKRYNAFKKINHKQ